MVEVIMAAMMVAAVNVMVSTVELMLVMEVEVLVAMISDVRLIVDLETGFLGFV